MIRPNFYDLLDLDCAARDAAKIDAAILAKQKVWSQERNHPKKGRAAQQNLGLIPEMRRLFQDEQLRDLEADECRKLRQEREKQAFEELDQHIEILSTKGYVLKREVDDLVKLFRGRVEESVIRHRIKVPERADSGTRAPPKPELEKSLWAEIEERLRIVGKATLYEFLDRPANCGRSVLEQRSKEVSAEFQQNNNKTAEVTAGGDLAGHCLRIFKDDQQRERYDNSEAQRGLRKLDPLIKTAGADRLIDAGELNVLLRKAKEWGIPFDDAENYIVELAERAGWSVAKGGTEAIAKLQRCGACGVLSPATVPRCSGCGEPLVLDCPGCGHRNASDSTACTNCGFATGNLLWARRLLRTAEMTLASGDVDQAEKQFQQALVHWPGFSDAASGLQKIAEHRRQQQQRRDEEIRVEQELREAQTQAEKAVQIAVDGKLYFEARKLLIELRQVAPRNPRSNAWSHEIDAAIVKARQIAEKAALLERSNKSDDALDAYADALRICADLPEARAGLSKHPPEPAQNASAVDTIPGVALKWSKSSSRGEIRYRVVRKVRVKPTTVHDGTLVGHTFETSLTDAKVEAGEIYVYGVFAERSAVVSLLASITAPVVHVSDVTSLTALAGDGCASLCWKLPEKATGVEIRRGVGAPPAMGLGELVTTNSRESLTDTGIINDAVYGYRVVALFLGPDGKLQRSAGTTCRVIPTRPPQPVVDLSIIQKNGQFEATWAPVTKGNVYVYISATRPTRTCGDTLPATDVDQLGTQATAAGNNQIKGTLSANRVAYLIPVTVAGTTAIIGQTVAVTSVEDVLDLKVTHENQRWVARWTWPKGVRLAVVTLRNDRFATSPADPQAARFECEKHHYEVDGGYRFDSPARPAGSPATKNLYVTVFAAVRDGDEIVYASGSSPGARYQVNQHARCVLKYVIRPKGHGFFGPKNLYELKLTPDAVTELPELLIVGRIRGVPLDPDSGTVLAQISQGQACSPTAPFTLLFGTPEASADWRFRVFAADAQDYDWIEFKPA